MEALHDVVKAGKARYLGASSMYAWQFAKAQHAAERHGWTRFVSMQNHYNLIYREEEREMIPLCVDQGVGVIPWSPLARGRLTRRVGHHDGAVGDRRVRPVALPRRGRHRGREGAGAWRTARVAPAQVALAWLLAQPGVTSPIVGITKPEHLTDAAAAVELTLTDGELEELGAGYVPHGIAGHQ